MRLTHRCPNCQGLRTERILTPLNGLDFLRALFLVRRYHCIGCNWPFTDFALNVRLLRGRFYPSAERTGFSKNNPHRG